ncbi:MAG: tetratricopeptide repeat protein, partial [Thermoanaerobaculia bacterium]|nr:tetratricopeptide repeat protein [Thermoanaerobaculia bacterium]
MSALRFALAVSLALLVTIAPTVIADDDLGRVDFPTSGSPAAQTHFLRGVLWLHSFEYADARAEFQKALELEPGFAMAVWGVAMSHNHPIWNTQELADARAALERSARPARS